MSSDSHLKNPAEMHREAVKKLVQAWKSLTGEDYSQLLGVKIEDAAANGAKGNPQAVEASNV